MGAMFKSALENGLISKHPMDGVRFNKPICAGEIIGLTWDSISWEQRTLTVNKTMEFRHRQHEWRAGPQKQSYRTIPLTNRAYDIRKSARVT